MVSDVRIRDRSLAAEGHGTHDRLRALQSRMFLIVSWQGINGRQRDEEVHDQVRRSKTLRAVRSGRGPLAVHVAIATGIQGMHRSCYRYMTLLF